MPARSFARRLALAALLLGLPRTAAAVCSAQDIITVDPSCPASGACTISRTHIVENGCTIDFGARAVALTGRLNLKSRSATLRAGSLSIAASGVIDAVGDGPAARGGTLIIETATFFVTQQGSRIDASGNSSGGELIVRAGTFITVGGRLLSEFLNEGASGGLIDLTAPGDITLSSNSTVGARGGSDSDGGGEINLTAGGNIVSQTELNVSALDGGFVELRADGTITMTDADASGGGDAGSGGCIDVVGGAGTTVQGTVVADGATGTFMTGGCGGLICFDGDTGSLTVGAAARISANGASPDGGGGQVSLLSLGSTVVSGTVEARGPTGETCGGDICIDTGLDATVNGSALLDASGGDAGGAIEVIAGRDITINGELDLRGRQQAALGGDMALRAGNAGSGQLRVANTIDVSSAPACSVENGCGQGGSTDLFGCNVTLTNAASLVATGPDGGEHNLTAREQLSVQGTIDARRTTATGGNGLVNIQHTARKAPNLAGATILPAPSTQAFTTCPTQGPTMPTCLDPCPTCGNGQIEYPETCDAGMIPPQSCSGCSRFCQVEDCDDQLVCTGDQCLPSVGCKHRVTPVCTEPPTPTPTATNTRPTATSTQTASPTPTASPSTTASATPTATPTASPSHTATQTRTATATATATATPSQTPTPPATATAIDTVTASPTSTATPTAPATDTPTVADTPTPVATATASTTATATVPETTCAGDCNGDGSVAINELITGVNIALGSTTVASCPSFDRNGDGEVAINELIAAVNAALAGC